MENKNDYTYYFVRDPQFGPYLFWEIIATICNPFTGIAALILAVKGHIKFMNKELDNSLSLYDISKKTAIYGCYFTAFVLVCVLIGIIIKFSK